MTARTPMLQQYAAIRAENPDVLLAMRVGDFYEFYGPDAEAAAEVLGITLTGRDDKGERIPMAGVPFHSVEKYLARLVAAGRKVALCEQLEDPRQAKGLVKRGVTRVLTPGTVLEDAMLDAGANNFLAAICRTEGRLGLAYLDASTGEFLATELAGEDAADRLLRELGRVRPAELLAGSDLEEVAALARDGLGSVLSSSECPKAAAAGRRLRERFEVESLAGFGIEEQPAATIAASMVLGYAERAAPLAHVEGVRAYSAEGYLAMDAATRRALEITANLADGSRRHTLLSVVDETRTAMGARLLRRWLEAPLLDRTEILARQEAVAAFGVSAILRGDARSALRKVGDLERLTARAGAGLAGPRDLSALRASLAALAELHDPLARIATGRLAELLDSLGDHEELLRLLTRALIPDPPPTARDGGVFREGHDDELDALRRIGREGRDAIAALEAEERAAIGVSGLKIGFNSVFGYYLEVPRAHASKVPERFSRKQTTAGTERYVTPALKELESRVVGSEERAVSLEMDLFSRLRTRVVGHARDLLATARALAELDVLASFSECASRRGYVRPEIAEEDVLRLESARHPVVEANERAFVPNDLALGDARCVVLTGPNMAGKSTYLRQTAMAVILAQAGACVPARSARIGICDRIFARIGARDELAVGRSTFMVEMVESAVILNHATARSLVVLDEVGRGTSTHDGLAIAWAMVERLAEIGAKTLFATHYHQLNALASSLPSVVNFRVAVEEVGEEVVWTHRVLPGGADRSYGLHVARMAGVPPAVVRRAAEVLAELEGCEPPPVANVRRETLQLTLFEAEEPEVIRRLRDVDPSRLTPMEALGLLDEWKRGLNSPA